MPFTFSGIFAATNESHLSLLERFRTRFGGKGRLIESPFHGFGVTHLGMAISLFPDDPGLGPNPKAEAMAKQFLDFSASCPEATFVFLYAECFGGVCEYAGFVFRGGQRIHQEPFRDLVGDVGPLKRLVSYLGIELDEHGYFAPLSRDFFNHDTPWIERNNDPPVPSERVRELSDKLASAWAPATEPAPKRSLWNRIFRGRSTRGS